MPDDSLAVDAAPQDFAARTPWTAGAAVTFTLIALVVAIACGWLASPLTAALGSSFGGGRDATGVVTGINVGTMLTLLVFQLAIIAQVWWGAGRFGADRRRLLSLGPSLPLGCLLVGLACMIALLVPLNLAVYWLWPSHFLDNMQVFRDVARSPARWVAAVAFIIGAPLSEELLFRGFLLPALCKTRLGSAGAAVLSSAAWTMLHFYTVVGLIEVFLVGLLLAWLMRRFGNLWLPIALHALYNGGQFVVLALWP